MYELTVFDFLFLIIVIIIVFFLCQSSQKDQMQVAGICWWEDGWCAGWVSLYPSRCAPRIQVHVPDWSKRRRLRCPPPWLGRNTEHRGLLGPWCTPSSCPHNLGGNKGSYYFFSLLSVFAAQVENNWFTSQ